MNFFFFSLVHCHEEGFVFRSQIFSLTLFILGVGGFFGGVFFLCVDTGFVRFVASHPPHGGFPALRP